MSQASSSSSSSRYFAQHSNLARSGRSKPTSTPLILDTADNELETKDEEGNRKPNPPIPVRVRRRHRRRYSDSSVSEDSDESSYAASLSSSHSSSSSSAASSSSSSESDQSESRVGHHHGKQKHEVGNTKRIRMKRLNASVVPSDPSSFESPNVTAAASPSTSTSHHSSMQGRKKVNSILIRLLDNPTIAPLIERALYSKHGGVNQSYNHHARQLISSLKLLAAAAAESATKSKSTSDPPRTQEHSDDNNRTHTIDNQPCKSSSLFEQISSGSLSATQLVNMSTSELAPESLQQARLKESQNHMRQSVVTSTSTHLPQSSSSVSSPFVPTSSANSKKRKISDESTGIIPSSIAVSKRTKKPIEVCEISDDDDTNVKNEEDDDLMILPPLEKPSFRSIPSMVASATLFGSQSAASPSAATAVSDHLPAFKVPSDSVPVYDGRLSFSQPRRGELHVHFYTLPAPLLFPSSSMDATLDCTQNASFPTSSSRLNCWRELLPQDLDEPQRMNLLKIDTYIQFKATSHKDAQSLSSSSIMRHENYHRFFPVTFVMRNVDILLDELRKDLTKFHLTHDLAIALNFEHSYIPVEQQCCVWLMPPDTIKHLSQDTMRRILHWSHVPPNDDWWGILWIKLGAYETMWQKFRTKQQKTESVMDVPSDNETDEQHLQQKTSESTSLSSISSTPQPPPVHTTRSEDPTHNDNNDLLKLMHNPAVASSTAQYLSNLLRKVRSAPVAAAVASIATAPVTSPAMLPSPYTPMPTYAYDQPPRGIYPSAPPAPLAYPHTHPHYPPNPHAMYTAPPPPTYPVHYPHAPAFPPMSVVSFQPLPPPPVSYGGLQPPYFPPLAPEDLQQSTWNSSVKQPRHR